MEIQPLRTEHLSAAAELFTASFHRLRAIMPSLPGTFEDPAQTVQRLENMVARGQGLAALENGQLAGYLTWYLVDQFRGTDRYGAYCPEWGHAAPVGRKSAVYRALYGAASRIWTGAGCAVHALTTLADDTETHEVWFWSGFGMTVVDAVRGMDPLDARPTSGFVLRRAQEADVGVLAELEVEHWRHYAAPPVFMAANAAESPEQLSAFLRGPGNSIWLALDGDRLAAYLRFTAHGDGAAAVLESQQGAHCTGAFTRPEYRGNHLAPALLDLAIRHYAAAGTQRMTVDFESINPEAASFWPRYYTPVCYSLTRIPEKIVGQGE